MGLARQVAFNTTIQLIGRILTTIFGLVTVGILTRYLGVAGYGDYTTVFAYLALFNVISDFGFFWIIVREISKDKTRVGQIVHNALAIRLLFAVFVAVIALVLMVFLPYGQAIKIGILLIGLAILWMSQNGVMLALFQAKLRMDKPVLAESISRLIALGLILLVVYLKLGLIMVIGAALLGTFLNFLLNVFLARSYVKFGWQFDWLFCRKIFLEALPLGIVSILGLIYFRIDTIILSILRGSTDVGIYGAPYKILEILISLPGMFIGSVFPALTAALTTDMERAKILFKKSFAALSMMAWPMMTGVFILAFPIIRFVAGQEFVVSHTIVIANHPISSNIILQVLIFAVGISFWGQLFTSAMIALGQQRKLLTPNIVALVFNVGLNLILIPQYSYLAAAGVTVFTQFLAMIWTAILLRKFLPFQLEFLSFFKALAASAMMALVLWALMGYNLFLVMIAGAAVYAVVLYFLGGYTRSTIKNLLAKDVI